MTVCIIGNSLSALTLAKALVKQNVYVDVLYSKKNSYNNKTRTIGISKSNIDYLNKHVVNVNKLLWKIKKIEIFSDNLNKEKIADFINDDEQVFSIIKNYQLYQLLEKNLFKNKYFNLKLFNNKNSSLITNYDLVINCDHSNGISKKYFSKKIKKNYDSKAFTTIITHEKILNNIAVQIFSDKGPLAFLPISNTQTSVVYSVFNHLNEKKENIKKIIQNKNLKYKIKKIDEISSFDLRAFNLRSYHHKNIMAFGDLLHKIHPFAGQGFNMTIRDIKCLINIIKEKFDLGLPLDESVSVQFENSLRHKNFIFLSGLDLIYEFFNIEINFKNNYLSKSVQLISKYPKINKIFRQIADKGALI